MDDTNYIDVVELAEKFAAKKHEGQMRKNGEVFLVHPLMVGSYIKKYKKNDWFNELVAAAYLHDVLEDTDTTYVELVKEFGYLIAGIVLELTTDKDMLKEIGKERYQAIRFKNMTSWALTIKLCDRLHNTEDLNDADNEFRERYANQTRNILDFLEENRELTKTQIIIIKDIRKNLEDLNI
jgi:Guanosine polyphosphate pyrophosphohydrolases/synthetases